MWRDEVQAFMLSAASSTPLDLFAKLKYEGHPGLWQLLLWLITRFTTDPISMQVAHLLVALGIWLLIWRASPFKQYEKLLLLLSYYLFWEYFILSRNYAIGVLLGFGFVALSLHRPEGRFWPWVLLGLLANTSVFATIWSFGLAGLFAVRNRTEWRALLPGATIYVGLTLLAIATIMPAPDASPQGDASFDIGRLDIAVRFVIGAFFPLVWPFVADTLTFIGGSAAKLAPVLINPVKALSKLVQASPGLTALVLILPILACWSIVRDRLLVATYAAVIIGIMLFAEIWDHSGGSRHYGFLFIALIGTVWMWRAKSKPNAWVWIGLLAVNALGGIATLSSELRPYSQSRNAADWLEQHHLRDEFLIGSHDVNVSPVAGYLRRPIYYLECECFGTYVKWSNARTASLRQDEFPARVARALEAEHKNTAIVIVSPPFHLAEQNFMPHLAFEPIKQFPNAIMEKYVVYRVTKQGLN